MRVLELIRVLQEQYEPSDYIIDSLWDMDDMEVACQMCKVDLTKEQKVSVMHMVESTFDSEVGINWEGICAAIRHYCNVHKIK